jgi:DNA-binding MarR family transcriptional regulator
MSASDPALPFDSRLSTLIKQAEQALLAEKNRALHPFDLTVPQYSALLVLAENPGVSSARLARLVGVTAQAMNSVVMLLEQRGLVSRTPSPDHGKVLLVKLTRAGATLLRRADQEAVEVEHRLASAFSGSCLAQLRDHLAAVIKTLSKR